MKDNSKYLINEDPIFFLPSLAKAIGLNEAILLQKIHGWLQCTPKEHVGRNWIYNSYKSWQEQLPFMSESTLKRTVKNLIEKEIILTNNFNQKGFDKTLWYSINYEKVEEFVEIYDSVKMTPSIRSNWHYDSVKMTPPIPINNNNNKENIIINNNIKEKFIKPTLEEVQQYCVERNNNVNAEQFIDYYTSNGWKVGKNNMKDWKATIRNWEKNNKSKKEDFVYEQF